MPARDFALDPQKLEELNRLLNDPVRLAAHEFDTDLWPTQQAILRCVATQPRTAVKACHASGKTLLAALAVLWWIAKYDDGIAITTAPTWEQVRDLLWGEIH